MGTDTPTEAEYDAFKGYAAALISYSHRAWYRCGTVVTQPPK